MNAPSDLPAIREVRRAIEGGVVQVGVDRPRAREFFYSAQGHGIPLAIGESLLMERSVVVGALTLSQLLLLGSSVFAAIWLKWWALAVIPVAGLVWFLQMGQSGHRLATLRPGALVLVLTVWFGLGREPWSAKASILAYGASFFLAAVPNILASRFAVKLARRNDRALAVLLIRQVVALRDLAGKPVT